MSDDGLALLRTVAAEPEEDSPRLVFADWCQENGQWDRAEFIRLEIEIARSPLIGTRENGYKVVITKEYVDAVKQRDGLLRKRPHGKTNRTMWKVGVPSWLKKPQFVRGFIGVGRCEWLPWAGNADAILKYIPLRKVTLLDFPPIQWKRIPALEDTSQEMRLCGPLTWGSCGDWFDVPIEEDPYKFLLGKRWPGITFDLPPDVGSRHVGTIAVTSPRRHFFVRL